MFKHERVCLISILSTEKTVEKRRRKGLGDLLDEIQGI